MLKRLNALPILFVLLCCVAAQAKFDLVQDKTGPALGDTIDLTSWRTRDGRTLAQVNKGHSLAMILLVSPSCGTCTEAKESFRTLRESVGKPGIPYYVLMIPDSTETQKYFSYADSLKIDAVSFIWSSTTTKAPISLSTMALPSHLLVTNEGLVVDKWPGTTPSN